MDPPGILANARTQVELTEYAPSIRRLLDEEQWFLAYDLARELMCQFPDDLRPHQWAAHALIRLGAVEEARKILEPLCVGPNPRDPVLLQLYAKFRVAARDVLSAPAGAEPEFESLEAFASLLGGLAEGAARTGVIRASDEETLGLLGRVYKDIWRESGRPEDARRCRDTYLRAFQATGGHWTCVNAATMSRVLSAHADQEKRPGESDRERRLAGNLAERACEICDRLLPGLRDDDRVWAWTSVAEAKLILGEESAAFDALCEAISGTHRRDFVASRTLEQLRLLDRHGCAVSPRIFELLKPPGVIVFAGHLIDRTGRPSPQFPPELESVVRQKIDEGLTRLDARIGYSSAACGADLIFLEAMLDRDAEVNIVLPFATDDFIRQCVEYAGPQWVRRFRRAVKVAGRAVTYATTEPYLGTDSLFGFTDRIIHGFAYFRAHSMSTEPQLLAVLNSSSARLAGGTANVVGRWPDRDRMLVIDPAALSCSVGVPSELTTGRPDKSPATGSAPSAKSPAGATRVVRTMLFADVVGFSRMQEDQVPYYMYQFLNEVARRLGELGEEPILVNTWGDAIFAVMRDALHAVAYAQSLQRVVCDTDWSVLGLPPEMNIRIALHAGPVFEGTDAVTGRPNCFGSHVNRAARIEPITLPGHIYASQQFVALLTAEQQTAAARPVSWPFACEYLGKLALAKNFGALAVYHVRNRSPQGKTSADEFREHASRLKARSRMSEDR